MVIFNYRYTFIYFSDTFFSFIRWFIQIAFGLQYIHKKNVLHRDLKTQNIFLTSQNIIKIGDFGISKVPQGIIVDQHPDWEITYRQEFYGVAQQFLIKTEGKRKFLKICSGCTRNLLFYSMLNTVGIVDPNTLNYKKLMSVKEMFTMNG